jgi:hypothetical protein
MFRRLIQILTAISFISLLGVTAFWVRSYWKSEHFQFTWKKQLWELNSADGKFWIDNEPEIARQKAAMQPEASDLYGSIDAKEKESREGEHIVEMLMTMTVNNAANSQRYYIGGVPDDPPPRKSPEIPPEKLEKMFRDASDNATKLNGEVSKLHYKWLSLYGAMLSLHARSITLPPPLFVIGTLILPALAYRSRLIRRIRVQVGLCGICGYDLRATPERCPECGAVAWKR